MNVGLLSYLRFQKECKREIQIVLPKLQIAPLTSSIKTHGFILRFNVFISAKLVKIITRHLLFIVFYVFISYIIVMLAQVCAILLFLWTPVSARILALVLQLNTHTAFNGPLSWTTRVSRYQKGKTNLDFTEARDSEWQWHQLDHIQVCNSLQTDNHASTSPVSILVKLVKIIFQNQRNKHANSALWLLETGRRAVTDQLKPRREQLS